MALRKAASDFNDLRTVASEQIYPGMVSYCGRALMEYGAELRRFTLQDTARSGPDVLEAQALQGRRLQNRQLRRFLCIPPKNYDEKAAGSVKKEKWLVLAVAGGCSFFLHSFASSGFARFVLSTAWWREPSCLAGLCYFWRTASADLT